jgi:hypothetical protein
MLLVRTNRYAFILEIKIDMARLFLFFEKKTWQDLGGVCLSCSFLKKLMHAFVVEKLAF